LLQGQADATESEVARLEAAKADAAKSLEGLLGSIEKLHSQELSLNQTCASAEEKLSEWTNTADQLISQVEVLSGQIGSLESQKLDAVVAMEGLLQQIDDAKSERDQWIEKNNHQALLVEEAEEKLASVKHQIQANETSLKDILNQLVSTELQYAKVAEGCLMEQAELQRLLECTRKAEADVDSVRAEKASLETRRSEILREIDGFEVTRDDAMHAAESATERLQYLESKLQEASAELQAFAIERAQYQQEIVKHEQVKANMAAAQLRLDDLIAQGQLMERASKDARDEWNQVQQAIRESKFEMDTLAEKEKRLVDELDGLRIERDKLESECQRFDIQRKASEQEINDRKASLDRVNEECAKDLLWFVKEDDL
jgi:chromosome segregation ATPase